MSPEPLETTPRRDAHSGNAILSAGIHGLPSDLLRECSGRLGYAALMWGGLSVLAAVLNNIRVLAVSDGLAPDGVWPWPGNAVVVAHVLVSLTLFAYTRRTTCDTKFSLDLGLFYEVFLALGIAVVDQWTPRTSGISWIALLVLIHPTVVPNTTRKTLLAGLVAATMDPVGVGIAAARGASVPALSVLVLTFLPTYLAAVVAVLPATIIRRLVRELHRQRELGSYVVGGLLGRGGMGEVYEAEHRLLRRPAAVKLVRPDATTTRESSAKNLLVKRFWREADAAASLSSPHSIALYDFGIAPDGVFYYIMERLAGLDFESLVSRFGPVRAGRAIHLLQQACHALAEAHAMGLIHRDIKPSNLYTCRVGLEVDFVKVTDFGLVKFAGSESPDDALDTAPNIALGTPAFMAPEAALAKQTVDHRMDIYGLGCVAYWLLTGELVFDAKTPMQMMMQHIKHEPVPPSRRTELRVPSCLDDIVLACLSKDPADRPSDAADLATKLTSCAPDAAWSPQEANRWWATHLPELITAPVGSADRGYATG